MTTQEVSETEEEAKALAEKKKEEAKAAGEDPDAEESEASSLQRTRRIQKLERQRSLIVLSLRKP